MKSPLFQKIWRLNIAALILCATLGGGCLSPNNPPVIKSLTAQSTVVRQTESTNIECIACDPDEDGLSYHWTMTGGSISGQGPTVTWIAPKHCADYLVTVTVADGRGGEASQKLKIKVAKPG